MYRGQKRCYRDSCSEISHRPFISTPFISRQEWILWTLRAKSPFWGTRGRIATKIVPGVDLDVRNTFDSMTFSRISHTEPGAGPETPKNGYFCVQTLLKHEPFKISKFYELRSCVGTQRSSQKILSQFYPSDQEE